MIDFKPVSIDNKEHYEKYLFDGNERGCEYSFANLYMWGRQSVAVAHDHLIFFSQYNRRSVYPFPVGNGDKKTVIDAVISDSKERGIPCRFTGLTLREKEILEEIYPGMFRFHCDRDCFDYVYDVNDLADLAGRKFHSKRNHYNRFCETYPDYRVEELCEENLARVKNMIDQWYEDRLKESPESDFQMEQIAVKKALSHYNELHMDGIAVVVGDEIVAVTLGSHTSNNTIDVHFEKGRRDINGVYAAINCEFAQYIRKKYPEIKYLNREEDMGLEGLRKAKESYRPHHLVEKYWACLLEEGYEY